MLDLHDSKKKKIKNKNKITWSCSTFISRAFLIFGCFYLFPKEKKKKKERERERERENYSMNVP